MAGTSSISGLISGLKTDEIITKLMEIAKRPQVKMQADKIDAQTRLATWQDLNTRVLALKSKADSLATSGAFENCQATSSDMGVLQATTGTGASPGTYYLTVKTRAQSHQIAGLAQGSPAAPFTSTTAVIGTGKVDFAFGLDPSKSFSVTIDSANNTLVGLRDAINNKDAGVQASIINSGTATSPAYQLVLNSTDTGDASKFTVSAEPSLTVDFSTVIQEGIDAEIQLGAGGAGATPITVKKATNTITDLIPGVTLSVMSPDADKVIKLDVTRGTGQIRSSIQDFVQQYNDLTDAIDVQFKWDAQSEQSGTLMGNWDLQSIQMQITSVVKGVVSGVEKSYSALATIGITQDTSGRLQINDATLTKALNDNLSDVSKLFAASMTSQSSYVSFLSSTSDTKPSPTAGWNVNVTQAARQAQITAGTAMTDVLDADETLTIYSDPAKAGSAKKISLSEGWSISRVIAEVNRYSNDTGVAAVATKADGTVSSNSGENQFVTLRSARYGSTGKVYAYSSVSSATGITSGIGNKIVSMDDATGESGAGQKLVGLDVEGTINGERCKGTGQMLSADPSSLNSSIKGLSVLVTSASAMSSTVHFSKGIGTSLRDALIGMTSLTGKFTTIQDSINKEIEGLNEDIADWSTRLTAQQDKLYARFDAMESQLAELQNQGAYLSQQIAAMNKSA